MITASEARQMNRVPQIIAAIEKRIKMAARDGHPGVWVDIDLSAPVRNTLQGNGYDLSHGNEGKDAYEDGVCREGQTWIYWG